MTTTSQTRRRRIIAANWKMYKTAAETRDFIDLFKPSIAEANNFETVLFPPSLSVAAAVEATAGSNIQVGGQNLFWEREGAYTGEVSGQMLRAAGALYVLIGHSERRQYFCETDANVLKKAVAAIGAGLKPIVCIGERLEEHRSGHTAEVLIKQFAGGLAGLTEEQFMQVAIAYEPIWAIGTGQTATPQIASDAHRIIRGEAAKRYGDEAGKQLAILYGGSVKPDNIAGLMAEDEIDGALVGGASLDAESFAKIVLAA